LVPGQRFESLTMPWLTTWSENICSAKLHFIFSLTTKTGFSSLGF